jgi:hypothetical protein
MKFFYQGDGSSLVQGTVLFSAALIPIGSTLCGLKIRLFLCLSVLNRKVGIFKFTDVEFAGQYFLYPLLFILIGGNPIRNQRLPLSQKEIACRKISH